MSDTATAQLRRRRGSTGEEAQPDAGVTSADPARTLVSNSFHGARVLFLVCVLAPVDTFASNGGVCTCGLGVWLWLCQVRMGQRVLTFVLNQALLRSTTPDVFGFASIELELLLATVLFLSREGVRLALLRSKVGVGGSPDALARAVNLSWASVPLGVVVAAATGAFFVWSQSSDTAGRDPLAGAPAAVLMYCIGAVLETMVEPAFIMSQNHLLYGLRGVLEVLAMMARCVVTYALVVAGLEAAAFGVAQIVFAAVLVMGYYGYFLARAGTPGFPLSTFRSVFPRPVEGVARCEGVPQPHVCGVYSHRPSPIAAIPVACLADGWMRSRSAWRSCSRSNPCSSTC